MNQDDNIANSASSNLENISKQKAYIIISVFFVALLGIIFILSKYVSPSNLFSKNKSVVSVSELVDLESYSDIKKGSSDSNNNGIENWREVAAGLDPTQNNDLSAYNFSTSTEEERAPDYTSNFTDLVSRDLYVAEQYQKQNQNIDMQAINTQLLKKLTDLLNPPKVQILKLIEKPTASEYKTYFNDMARLLSYMVSSEQVELQELASSTESEIYDFKKTRDYASNLNVACEKYKLNSVPKEYAELHTITIFECEKYVLIMDSFMSTEKDPVKSKIASDAYKKSILNRLALIKLYSEKVKNMSIYFSAKDAGAIYYLTK